ncbi:hypothetical protein B0H10DRAFT_1837676 [Mycena sp. CBHHK59/15]|nr:hypothetical protein B0H10DRAFT_1837676 [Mycena sp. CBHHK59/15]
MSLNCFTGFACFVCNKEGSSLEQTEGLCTLCPTALLSVKSLYKLVEHMAIHILFDHNPLIDRSADPCGFCAGTKSHCSIVLVKCKGMDDTIRIDLTRSHCPHLANLGLESAAKSSKQSPCMNGQWFAWSHHVLISSRNLHCASHG